MDYKVYENVFSNDFVEELLQYAKNNRFQDGMVGNRVDPKQKIRKDLFISNDKLIKDVDNIVYDKIYDDVKKEFDSDIKFRERWKFGWYKSDDGGYYNVHRDDIIATKYRKMSMTVALSDPSEYGGGEFYLPELKKEFKLKKGDAIVFRSSVMHGVKPVTSGERYILASFMFDDDGRRIKEELKQYTVMKHYIPILDNIKIEYDKNDIKDIIYPDYLKNEIVEAKGDIDYSDKYKNSLWADNDDYYFEDNSGDTLLVLFAGMGWKDCRPTFIFYNFLKKYKNIDKLFLRDTGPKNTQQICCRYYMLGFRNNTNNLQESIDFVSSLINREKYKKVYGMGVSAGGFASILYGHLLKFDKVIAFSPQVVLNKKKEELIGDKCNAPKTCQWLTNKNPNDEFYQNCLDLKNFLPFDTKIDIHYAKLGSNGMDKKHALYLESENCKIIEHDSNTHMLALELRDKGKLKEIIDELIE
jgi:predicted 2-oxoglutarate/Fe(II)-dependent dioxygenase YbiX